MRAAFTENGRRQYREAVSGRVTLLRAVDRGGWLHKADRRAAAAPSAGLGAVADGAHEALPQDVTLQLAPALFSRGVAPEPGMFASASSGTSRCRQSLAHARTDLAVPYHHCGRRCGNAHP